MLTENSHIFHARLDEAAFLADCCGVLDNLVCYDWTMVATQDSEFQASLGYHRDRPGDSAGYFRWEDRQTAGGGIRITWKNGVMWISSHSGYAWADVTDTAILVARDMGLRTAEGRRPMPPYDRD